MLRALPSWRAGLEGSVRADKEPQRRADKLMILVGDLNIAPLASDVWNHKQLLKVVSHTPVEVAALDTLQSGLGWVDAVRRMIPPEQSLETAKSPQSAPARYRQSGLEIRQKFR